MVSAGSPSKGPGSAPPDHSGAASKAASAYVNEATLPDPSRTAMLTVLRQHPTDTRWSGRSATTMFALAVKALPSGEIRQRAVPALLELTPMLAIQELLKAKSLLDRYAATGLTDATTLRQAVEEAAGKLEVVGKVRGLVHGAAVHGDFAVAYVIAFVKAKKNLAEILGGLKNEGRESIREELLNITLADQEMTNAATVSEEVLRQTVDMMLRGFVIYEVKDDTDQNAVFVSIVTTPQTRRHVHRPASNVVVAGDVQEGIDLVLDEIRTGLVPPVGGRIVSVPSTGQTAFVGFGSAIVHTSTNRAIQAKNNYTAKRIAGMRSKDALCGLLIGDRTTWEGGVVETLQDEVREFEPVMEEDPMAMDGKKMAQPLETFRSTQVFKEVYESARKGILPPGVITKTWFDEDHAWSYGMSVFWANVNVLAEGAAADMARGPLFDRRPSPDDRQPGQASGPFTDQQQPGVKRPGKEVKQGPTGKIEPE
jgi:hypothetical protein